MLTGGGHGAGVHLRTPGRPHGATLGGGLSCAAQGKAVHPTRPVAETSGEGPPQSEEEIMEADRGIGCTVWRVARRASVCALLAMMGVTLAAAAATPTMTDQSITDAVEDELAFDRAVPLNDIDVRTHDGIATLTGSVHHLLAKRRAGRIAETIKGVRAVVNRIEVDPPWSRMDWEIESDAEDALLFDPATESWEIDVTVADNIATLSGTVDSWRERELAERVVAGVRGVAGISNGIAVDFQTTRADAEIREEIERALAWDVLVEEERIDVAVNGGEVTLSGTVGSAAERSEAILDARVAGVTAVDSEELTVNPLLRHETQRRPSTVIKTDDEIEAAVQDALLYDPRVASYNVEPDVEGAWVRLRGQVATVKAKQAAEQVARRTTGVLGVENRLRVRAEERTDDQVGRAIRRALQRDPYVEGYQIGVAVADRDVYLSGAVDTYFEKGRAQDIASRARGVEDIHNNLDVQATDYALVYDPYVFDYYFYDADWYDYAPFYTFESDAEIRDDVESELWWSPYVNEEEIAVAVDDGFVTLTGTVDSWAERLAATENAYEGGAVWVDNDLVID
ncbi:MAG: BON domain-containing protein [Candidatus Eisenbacteria bacterium]|nr:BON domain-containing protein [Candidatus Eisenbacteria bacterium]